MADAGTQALKAVSADLAPRLAELFDPAGMAIPKKAASVVAKAAKSIDFAKDAKVGEITQALVILSVYGELDRAAEVARLLATVPNTGNLTLFEPLPAAIVAAAWFQQSSSVTAELESLAKKEWTPLATRAKGILLRQPLKRSAAEQADFEGYPPVYFASEYLADIEELAVMAFLGGSFSWNRKKITAEIDTLVAALYALPGFAPVAS